MEMVVVVLLVGVEKKVARIGKFNDCRVIST